MESSISANGINILILVRPTVSAVAAALTINGSRLSKSSRAWKARSPRSSVPCPAPKRSIMSRVSRRIRDSDCRSSQRETQVPGDEFAESLEPRIRLFEPGEGTAETHNRCQVLGADALRRRASRGHCIDRFETATWFLVPGRRYILRRAGRLRHTQRTWKSEDACPPKSSEQSPIRTTSPRLIVARSLERR